jgi:hypothetical protein
MIGQVIFRWQERRQRRWEQRMAAEWDRDWEWDEAWRLRIWQRGL